MSKKMNKRGFTLVELLAVIVVLAIVMVIAFPATLRAVNNAKRGAFQTFTKRVWSLSQTVYQNHVLMPQINDGVFVDSTSTKPSEMQGYSYCINIKNLGLDDTGSYKGYVLVKGTTAGTLSETAQYKIYITDGAFVYNGVSGSAISSTLPTEIKDGITMTVPGTSNYPGCYSAS